ncbi:hypothetical protein BD626DRAFT_461201 [Schizophyllum amplum]|uniref:Uncharacterized protein n=1 Tax=Schizophyllum amplum TaxID=97359 RepID=A0A550C6G6_9AGAR|nr:hypothetical protein BD626DRAFT_461201 [Auriculariopsis ampla]
MHADEKQMEFAPQRVSSRTFLWYFPLRFGVCIMFGILICAFSPIAGFGWKQIANPANPLFMNNELFFFVLASFYTFVVVGACFGLYANLCRSLTLTRMYRALLWLQSTQSIGIGIYLLVWLYRQTRLQWDALCAMLGGTLEHQCDAYVHSFVAWYAASVVMLWVLQIYTLRLIHRHVAVLREDKVAGRQNIEDDVVDSLYEAAPGYHAPILQYSPSDDKDDEACQRPASAYECLASERQRLADERKRIARKSANYLAREIGSLPHGPSPEVAYLTSKAMEVEELEPLHA